MRKALVVAYYFPPIAASGSLRALGFCRYLERYGWLPRVLTTDPGSVYPPQGIDESLGVRLPVALHIDTVPHANPLQAMIRARDKLREALQRLHHHSVNQRLPTDNHLSKQSKAGSRGQLSSLKELVLDWAFSFPDPQCFWLRPAVRRLARLSREECPDVVFATGSPWTGLLIGQILAKQFGVPFIADFRDPWTGNPYHSFSAPFLVSKAKQLERSVCLAAARVITNTEELRTKFRAEYPELEDKFVTITNGFDSENCLPPMSSDDGYDHSQPLHSNGQMLELCHFGTVYGKRHPLPLLQAIAELAEENLIRRDALRVRFVGAWEPMDDRCETLARNLEKQGLLQLEARIPHHICLQQMAQAKVLLILQPDSPLQIPGKIYEYIGSGRPLLVIGGEGATTHLVERHGLGMCCPNQVSDIKKLLLYLANGQMHVKPPHSADTARFDYRALAGELAEVFNVVCSPKSTEL